MIVTEELLEKLDAAKHVAALTGAGVSAESGLETFRDAGGLWSKFSPQELSSVEGFMRNPKLVWEWYQMRVEAMNKAKPNPGHYALAEMEELFDEFTLVTQNIDRLHQRAGSKIVHELHGNIVENKCLDCGKPFDGETALPDGELARCPVCGGLIRPNVVWFGEMLPAEAIMAAELGARTCDVFFSIGTSAEVYPAANLPYIALQSGAYVVEVNPKETVLSPHADAFLKDPSGEALPFLLRKLTEYRERK